MYSSDQLVDYVKINRRQLVNSVLDTLRNESDLPVLIIMAGYPGSGKTEYIKSSPELKALPTLDLDNLVTLLPKYKPKNYYTYRKAAGRLLSACFEKAIKKKFTFILEGTFSSSISLLNIERALKRGYTIQVIRMLTPQEKSWQYAIARKIITGRPTDYDSFVETVRNVNIVFEQAKQKYQDYQDITFKEIKR